MLSKHAEPSHWKHLTPANAFRADVEDLGAANLISASRCQRLLGKAVDVGVEELGGHQETLELQECSQAVQEEIEEDLLA